MDDLLFPTREAAQAAADKDLAARREGWPEYPGKRFLLVYVEGEWAEADEFSQPAIDAGETEGWGVCDEAGEQMLGTDGEWYDVA